MNRSDWIALGALAVSVASFVFTWWRGRTWLTVELGLKVMNEGTSARMPTLTVHVANPSAARVSARFFRLRAGGWLRAGGRDFPADFYSFGDPEPGDLEQGQGALMAWNGDEIRGRLRGAGIGDSAKVRVYCVDALGRKHWSRRKVLAWQPPPPGTPPPTPNF